MTSSFKKVYQSTVLLMAIALCTGCAHTIPGEESANYQTFIETEQQWFQLLYADDMDAALALVSEDFTSEAYVNKASLAQYMSFMQGKNIMSEEKLDKSNTTLTFNDTTANMGPYGLAVFGHAFSFTLDFTLEEAGWRITGMDWARE